MKAFIFIGEPNEIVTAISGLRDQGIITDGPGTGSTVIVSEPTVHVCNEQGQTDCQTVQAEPEQQKKKPVKNGPKDYYQDGTVYKTVIDMFNAICTKLAHRSEHCNYDLKKKIDKLFSKENPMQMEEIRKAFEAYQTGEWFDNERNRSAYGNFLWCIQRSKLENALMGKYKYDFNKEKEYGSERKTTDRQELGGDGIASRGFDF